MVDRAGFEPAASASFGWTCEGGVCTDDYAVVIHAKLNYRPTKGLKQSFILNVFRRP